MKSKIMVFMLFLVSLVYFGVMTAPKATWCNTDCDGFIYLIAARFHTLTHPVGAPLYNAINNAVIHIPIGTEFFRLAFFSSAIPSSITAVLIYLIAKKFTKNKLRALIAPTVWLASGLVVSQSTIIETYAMSTTFVALVFYLHLIGKNRWKYVVGGLGGAVHPLLLFVVAPLIVSDWWNSNRDIKGTAKNMAFLASYFIPFIYIPLCNREPLIWITGTGILDLFGYVFLGGAGLMGGLAIIPTPDLICRIQDLSNMILGGFFLSLILIIPGIILEIKQHKYLLTALFLTPIIFFFSNAAPQTYVYMMPSFIFGGLLAIEGIELYKGKWRNIVLVTVLTSSLGLMVFNLQHFDIGKNLDKELAADNFYQELDNLPNKTLVWCSWRQWEHMAILYYNLENNTDIYPIGIPGKIGEWETVDGKASDEFLARCNSAAVEGRFYVTDSISSKTKEAHLRQINLEEFVELTETETYWKQHYYGINPLVMPLRESLPSRNPIINNYELVTGNMELERWSSHIKTNKTFMFFSNLIAIGGLTGFTSKITKSKKRKTIIWILGMILLYGAGYIMTSTFIIN